MPADAAAYNVGGMAAFWTATIVRQHPNLERSPIICDKECEELYSEADAVLRISSQLFDFSIRRSVVTDALCHTYSDQTESVSIKKKLSHAGQRYLTVAATYGGPVLMPSWVRRYWKC